MKENPRPSVCDRLGRTRVSRQRQFPTDHDYVVLTREYQLDQSSPLLPGLLLTLSAVRTMEITVRSSSCP